MEVTKLSPPVVNYCWLPVAVNYRWF